MSVAPAPKYDVAVARLVEAIEAIEPGNRLAPAVVESLRASRHPDKAIAWQLAVIAMNMTGTESR